MTIKRHKFYSQYSPLIINKPNKSDSSIQGDWFRVAHEDATINGIPVKNFRDQYNQFDTDEDVKQFFNEAILKDIKLAIEKKEEVANYLLKVLHQGGLMYPVSSSMANMLHDEAGLQPLASGNRRQLRITTTENGFKVQEIYTSNNLLISDIVKAEQKGITIKNNDQETLIKPDKGKNFVIKAGACITVDFSTSTSDPSITIDSNYISYGNKRVQSGLDKRNLYQIIVDFFRNILGLNSVKIVSVEQEQQDKTQNDLSDAVQESSLRLGSW